VVAVEGLGFDRVPCQNENLDDGFATLCRESVRFTHAYGNSTSGLANLASLLTGEFPWVHGLRGQSEWLEPKVETVAEAAVRNSYRSLFVSSGLPVLSKTGLAQGFETFDDRIDLFSRPHFRSAEEVVNRWLSWQDHEEPDQFFSVLHLSDLLYPFELSRTVEGEPRELSVTSQLEEVSEELGRLISELKSRGLWNSTFFVLVGLNGGSDPSSLKSIQTQVTLMIKPSRAKKDQGTSWGVDFNVSLTDLGVTLYEIVTKRLPDSMVNKTTLTSVFYSPTPNWDKERKVRTEMYWAFENFGLDVVQSSRSQSFFYVHKNPAQFFNTLTDRQEVSPLSEKNSLNDQRLSQFREEFTELNIPASSSHSVPNWFYQGVEGFRKGVWPSEGGTAYGTPLRGWTLRDQIESRQWQKVAEDFKEERLIHFVAQEKLSPGSGVESSLKGIDCATYFFSSSAKKSDKFGENCDAERLRQFLDWARFKGTSDELFYESRFRWSFQLWWARLELGAMNYAAFGGLGVPLMWPKAPDVSEMFLIHSERKPHNRTLMRGYTAKGKY